MNYLKRKADEYLINWKNSPGRLPLIVKGARQIGKTESIHHFAAGNYENIIEINFIEEPQYRGITADGYKPDSIIRNITRIDPSQVFIPGKTLIFFDEIQTYPELLTSLKFFAIDGRFDVICSGSLLGINYKQIESISVGYKTDYEMQSLDFEEFLWAKGYSQNAIDELLENMLEIKPFTSVQMTVFSTLFLDYCILGGMPAVVSQYITQDNFSGTLELQQQLILAYREDIRKYVGGLDQTRILNVFDAIPAQLAKENKKFQISKVKSGAKFKDYWGCIEWLRDAGIINICYCLNFPELPLKGNFNESKYKLYYKDTGLLVASLDEEAQWDLRANRSLGVYKGGLYENFVGEAMSKCGYDLYYYKRDDGTLEEDFFVRTAHTLIPIEVKARNSKAQSLTSLINNERYPDISEGIKLCSGNIGHVNNIYTFPYFCTFLLKRYIKDKYIR